MAKKGDLALVRIQASGVMYQNPYRYVPGKIGYRFAIVDAASRDGDVKKVWGRKDLTAVYTRSASTIGNVAALVQACSDHYETVEAAQTAMRAWIGEQPALPQPKRKPYKTEYPKEVCSDADWERKGAEYALWIGERNGIDFSGLLAAPDHRPLPKTHWARVAVSGKAHQEKRIRAVTFAKITILLPHWDWVPEVIDCSEQEPSFDMGELLLAA